MKKKFTIPLAASFLLLLLTSIECKAQQSGTANYTYKVFQAPNKNFGYDIFENGKIVYHEFASLNQTENTSRSKTLSASKSNGTGTAFNTKENLALVRSEHAEKAALLAIEKMKRKELPVLSKDEIKKIIAQ
jgi:hypothetical protein